MTKNEQRIDDIIIEEDILSSLHLSQNEESVGLERCSRMKGTRNDNLINTFGTLHSTGIVYSTLFLFTAE